MLNKCYRVNRPKSRIARNLDGLTKFFKFVTVSVVSILNHPCSFMVYSSTLPYLSALLFSGFLQFKSNFACHQNNSKYRDGARFNLIAFTDAVRYICRFLLTSVLRTISP